MSKINEFFRITIRGSSYKKEIIGGLITFITMCYVLPVNAQLMAGLGMNTAGLFAMTALVSCAATLIMAIVGRFPLVLSSVTGIIAYLVSIKGVLNNNWHQAMILLTIAGIIFFVFSVTPLRRKIIESIPRNLQLIISCSLGAFLCLVGFTNIGVVKQIDTGLAIGEFSFSNPSVLIGFLGFFLCIGFMFSKSKKLKDFSIPIVILICALATFLGSLIVTSMGQDPTSYSLPLLPWDDSSLKFGVSGVDEVVFYGLLKDSYSGEQFGNDIVAVLSNPASYIALFSICFINLFDTSVTLFALGGNIGIIDETGHMRHFTRVTIADACGSLICGPLGTATVTSYTESSVGIKYGAKTGFSSLIAALMFLIVAFIYPIFSLFASGCVTGSVLIVVGASIFATSLSQVNFKDYINIFITAIVVLFTLLTYSMSNGIGIALLAYTVAIIFSGRRKELNLTVYIIDALFLILFILQTIMDIAYK